MAETQNVKVLVDSIIDRMHKLAEEGQLDDATSLYEEFKELIDVYY